MVPTFILYINNTRIPGEREAEVKEITILEKMNNASSFYIRVADPLGEWQNNDDYYIGGKVKILIGYKDEMEEIIQGDITGIRCNYKKNQAPEVIVCGQNGIHRLKRSITNTAFSEMTVTDIITMIADNAGLRADVDDLPYEHPFTVKMQKNDYEYLFLLAERYDCFFSVNDDTLTFKRLVMNKSEDVILEYGKTLLQFLPQADTARLISSVTVNSWNPQKHEFQNSVSESKDFKASGGIVVNDQFDGAETLQPDQYCLAKKDLEQRTVDILIRNNRDYITGKGTTYGNPEIRAGSIVNVKGLGEKFSDNYFVLSTTHKIHPLQAYTTSFTFTTSLASPSQSGGSQAASQKTAAAAAPGQDEDQEEDTNVKITNLNWKKDGKVIDKAHVSDIVLLTAVVSGIDDGESVTLAIFEHDDDGQHDEVSETSVTVKNSIIEYEWKVIYMEDTDDSNSAQEQEEKGFTLPEFIYTIEYKDVSPVTSPLLHVVADFVYRMLDYNDKPMAGFPYKLLLSDGSIRNGKTNDDGYIIEDEIPVGKTQVIL